MQNAILELRDLGRMPDSIEEKPTVETYLIEAPSRSAEYRQLVMMCSSDEWRETLQIRLDNWEKKR